MEFQTPLKLMVDSEDKGTIFVHWVAQSSMNDQGIIELKPIILKIIDVPISGYKIKTLIKPAVYTTAIALYLESPAHYNSKKNILTLTFNTVPI